MSHHTDHSDRAPQMNAVTEPKAAETPADTKPVAAGTELEFIWRAFTNLNDWVRFSDSKVAAVLAADGVLVGSIAAWLAGSHTALLHQPVFIVWLTGLIVASFYSAAYALASLMPKLTTSEESSSLVFFMDIARRFPSSSEFKKTICEALADPEQAVTEIAQQVWCNSKVAKIKYERVAHAIRGLTCTIYIGFGGVMILAIFRIVEAINGQ